MLGGEEKKIIIQTHIEKRDYIIWGHIDWTLGVDDDDDIKKRRKWLDRNVINISTNKGNNTHTDKIGFPKREREK